MAERLSDEEQQFIRDHSDTLTQKHIAEKLNRTTATVRRFQINEGLIEGKPKQKARKAAALEATPDLATATTECYAILAPLAQDDRGRVITAVRVLLGMVGTPKPTE